MRSVDGSDVTHTGVGSGGLGFGVGCGLGLGAGAALLDFKPYRPEYLRGDQQVFVKELRNQTPSERIVSKPLFICGTGANRIGSFPDELRNLLHE